MEAVLKTVGTKVSVGSNPTLCAMSSWQRGLMRRIANPFFLMGSQGSNPCDDATWESIP